MKHRIAKFSKVEFNDFLEAYAKYNSGEVDKDYVREIYDDIRLPQRATAGSAGYDFYAPYDLHFENNYSVLVPTGIRVEIDEGWVLNCYPRSGLGFKYKLRLNNTVGIIDSDYYYSDNGGHIFAKMEMTVPTNHAFLTIVKDKAFMQGVFTPYGITYDDDVTTSRNGGFGSTDKKV